MENPRQPEHDVDQIFLDRWSPRAMSGENITTEDLMKLFEAAKWAPSASNIQPWRFVYATKGSEHWDNFFNLLVEFNQMWCKNASVLVVIVSQTKGNDGNDALTNSFDAGAAWENFALQGSINGLVTHCMAGFDYKKAREVLNVPDDFKVEAMIAVGKPGELEMIPERMRKQEVPNDRRELSETFFEGKFNL